jgi:hypothetical protein
MKLKASSSQSSGRHRARWHGGNRQDSYSEDNGVWISNDIFITRGFTQSLLGNSKFEFRARGSVVVKAICCKQEGRGSETRRGEWSSTIYQILPATLGPVVYSASNKNEYQKQKNNVSGEYSAAGA